MKRTYPDISGILRAKAQRRRALAALPWEEKVAIIERMRRSFPRDAWGKNRARDRSVEGGGVGRGAGIRERGSEPR